METDVAYGAVATDDPDFGRLADFLLGHERIIEVRECEVAGFARDVFGAIEERIDEALGDNGAAGAIDDCGLGDDHEIVAPSWKSESSQGWGCGFESAVEPSMVLQPVLAQVPQIKKRDDWLGVSCAT